MAETLMILTGANPVHVGFGRSVGADEHRIKDGVAKGQFAPLKALRLVKNSLGVPNGYRTVLCESCYYYPAIKKRVVGLKSRIININCGPLIYNLLTRRIGGVERKVLVSLLADVKAHLVLGNYGVELLEKMDPGKPMGIVYPYISEDRHSKLIGIKPKLESTEITIIATNDLFCKGLDIAIAAFNKALEHEPRLSLNIVGNIDKKKLESLDSKKSGRINYLGVVSDVPSLLARTGLYIQPSRGDAFSVASLEAMAAGVPTIVSEENGAKEAAEKISPEFICKTDADDLAEKIIGCLGMPKAKKAELSKAAREAAKPFTKEIQLKNFREEFGKLAC